MVWSNTWRQKLLHNPLVESVKTIPSLLLGKGLRRLFKTYMPHCSTYLVAVLQIDMFVNPCMYSLGVKTHKYQYSKHGQMSKKCILTHCNITAFLNVCSSVQHFNLNNVNNSKAQICSFENLNGPFYNNFFRICIEFRL